MMKHAVLPEYLPYAVSPDSKWIAFERRTSVLASENLPEEIENSQLSLDDLIDYYDVYLARTDGSRIFRFKKSARQ